MPKILGVVGIIAFFLVIVPIVLNYTILHSTLFDMSVVQTYDSANVWLSFWGSYLAAVGSFALGWLAYHQNKKLQELDEKRDNRAIYVELESYVNKSEKLHSFSKVEEMCGYLENGDIYRAKASIYDYQTSLQEFSNNLCKFLEDKRIKDDLFEYGNKLASINMLLLKIIEKSIEAINNDIVNCTDENRVKRVKELHDKLLKDYYAPTSDSPYVELLESGHNALINLSKKLLPPTEK